MWTEFNFYKNGGVINSIKGALRSRILVVFQWALYAINSSIIRVFIWSNMKYRCDSLMSVLMPPCMTADSPSRIASTQ